MAALDSTDAVTRRRFLGAGGVAAAVAATGSAVALAAPPAGAVKNTVTLTAGSGQGNANRAALVAALAALPSGETLSLPAGTYEVDTTNGSIPFVASGTIEGDASGTTLDVHPKAPTANMPSLFNAPGLTSGRIALRDLQIDGPTTGSTYVENTNAFDWTRANSTGHMRAERLVITGLFGAGVQRSGLGLLEVLDCDINAWESPVKSFDSSLSGAGTPNGATCVIRGGHHTGVGSKSTSVGLYIHPHVALLACDVHYETFNRYAFYANGGPGHEPEFWTVTDVIAEDCSLAQTASNADAMFIRVANFGTANNGGGYLKGSATFVDCKLALDSQFGLGTKAGARRQFFNCWIEPPNIFLSAGADTHGVMRFVDCTWKIAGNGRALNMTAGWDGDTRFIDSTIYDCGSTGPYIVQVQGTNSLHYEGLTVDSARSNHGLSIGGSVAVTGAPNLVNTSTCPTSPPFP